MAYDDDRNYVNLAFQDVRNTKRNRKVQMVAGTALSDANALLFHVASKSKMAKFWQGQIQIDDALTADADSEVGDTLRLYFELTGERTGHFDIVDPNDDLFLDTSGPNANIAITKASMDAGDPGTPEDALGQIIDLILAGTLLISDSETPTAYLKGERLV